MDLVVGWMTDDNEQLLGDVYIFCYDVIQLLEPYFRQDLDFILSFLTHVLAEIESGTTLEPICHSRLFRLIKYVTLIRIYF